MRFAIIFQQERINLSQNLEEKVREIIPRAISNLDSTITELKKFLQPSLATTTTINPQIIGVQTAQSQTTSGA